MSKFSIYPPTLSGDSPKQKRQEIREYFLNTYTFYEKIFELLKDESVFYKKSEPTRHPMIFYYGHTATFFINKLILMKVIKERINPKFESIFAVGVDEMSWDDVESKNYKWPKVSEVKEYRDSVKEVVLELIETLPLELPITRESEMWILLMGIEHERIHIETSLVLHRQMPLEFIKDVEGFEYAKDSKTTLSNKMLEVALRDVTLGKDENSELYGWDNENGVYKESVESFQASKYLVSNAEFMEFVKDNGYKNLEYWDDEGKEFLKGTQATHPTFWVKDGEEFKYRTLSSLIEMPQNFPVDVNALEAEAFCRYISKRDGVKYSLPSEGEYRALQEQCNIVDIPAFDEKDANQNLNFMSATSVDKYVSEEFYDVVGNVWQWSRTPIFGFEGFRVHKAYDDFSTPTFDNKHSLILGSSWASSGNLIMKHSRYAFRKHFYQNAGFRYVISHQKESSIKNSYEDDVVEMIEYHYESDRDYSYITKAMKYVSSTQKALDFGCSVGRSSFELARYFQSVEGVDISARFIRVGVNLQENESVEYRGKTVALESFGYERVQQQVAFKQADSNNLKPIFEGYNLVVARVDTLDIFLESMRDRVESGTVFIVFDEVKTEGFELLEESKEFKICKKI